MLIFALYTVAALVSFFSRLPIHPLAHVWLPAGVAFVAICVFGYRYWLIVVLASLISHLLLFSSILHSSDMAVLIGPSLAMTLTATFQAVIGAYAVRVFYKTLNLEHAKDILIFLGIGGPVSCLIGSFMEVMLLGTLHVIGPDSLAVNWFFLWARSTVGVLLGTAIVMPWIASPEESWKPRQSAVSLPMAFLLVLTLFVSSNIRVSREQQLHERVDTQTADIKNKVRKHIENYFKSLYALQKYYSSHNREITKTEFKNVTRRLLNHKSMIGLAWMPKVEASEKEAWLQSIKDENDLNGFEIKDMQEGSSIKSPLRETYFPVVYAEPLEKNEAVLGVDLLPFTPALAESLKSGKLTLSKPIQLPQGIEGVIAFLPLYDHVPDQSRKPAGALALFIDMNNLISRDLFPLLGKIQSFEARDKDSLRQETILYAYVSPSKDYLVSPQYAETTLDVGGRQLVMRTGISPENLMSPQEKNLLMVAWGLLGLLSVLLMIFSGRKILMNRLILKNKELQTEIEYSNKISQDLMRTKEDLLMLSLTDPLTGLTNRRGLQIHAQVFVKLAKRHNKRVFLLFIDLDNMKQVNDTYGHKEGDLLLIEVSRMLKEFFREMDIIARLGGDEFCVLITANEGDENLIVQRLQLHIEQYNKECKRPLSLSVGWAMCDSSQEFDLEKLVIQADKMMYLHKQSKKNKGSRLEPPST